MTGSAYIESVDLSGLNYFVSALQGALLGRGPAEGDAHRLLRTEAGQLAWEISQQLGPSTRSRGLAAIDKDLRSVFTIKPAYSIFTDPERQQESSYADFTWLTAGPNWLLGINDEDNQLKARTEAALQEYRAARHAIPRGKALIVLGKRGHQTIQRLNRIRISRATLNSMRRLLGSHVGELKASFAATAARLVPSKRIPGWVRDRIPAVQANGKTVYNDSLLQHPVAPSLEFGSRARGVETNPAIVAKIQGAVTHRSYLLAAKLRKIATGYAYDWNTGRVFKPSAEASESSETMAFGV